MTYRDSQSGYDWTASVVVVGHGLGLFEWTSLGSALLATLALFYLGLRQGRGVGLPGQAEAARRAVFVALLLGPAVAACLYTLEQPISAWDGLVIWYAKVRGLYDWRPLALLPFANYPDLGPTCWMLVLKWVGVGQESIGRLIFPAFYFFWIAAIRELWGRPHSWLLVVVVPATAVLFFDLEMFTNGYQDGFVMAAAGMSAIFMVKNLIHIGSIVGERSLCERLERSVATVQGRQDCYLAAFFAGMLGLIKSSHCGIAWGRYGSEGAIGVLDGPPAAGQAECRGRRGTACSPP